MIEMTIDQHQSSVIKWANDVFPARTPKDILLKLNEELGELIKNPTDPLEYADVMILLLDFAAHNDISGTRILPAIEEKMEINHKRKWAVDLRTGIMHHV